MPQSKGARDPHVANEEQPRKCFVCDHALDDLSFKKYEGKTVRGREENDIVLSGLVEIHSDGTGFASGGTNMAKRQGVAFQC